MNQRTLNSLCSAATVAERSTNNSSAKNLYQNPNPCPSTLHPGARRVGSKSLTAQTVESYTGFLVADLTPPLLLMHGPGVILSPKRQYTRQATSTLLLCYTPIKNPGQRMIKPHAHAKQLWQAALSRAGARPSLRGGKRVFARLSIVTWRLLHFWVPLRFTCTHRTQSRFRTKGSQVTHNDEFRTERESWQIEWDPCGTTTVTLLSITASKPLRYA